MGVTAKGFLEDARRLQEAIRHASEQIERADAMLGLHGLDTARERVSGGGRADMLAENVGRLQGYRDELAGLLATYLELQRFADRTIAKLRHARHQQVLNMRYLEGKEWRQIARETSYSLSNVYELHRQAHAELDDVLAGGNVDNC